MGFKFTIVKVCSAAILNLNTDAFLASGHIEKPTFGMSIANKGLYTKRDALQAIEVKDGFGFYS